MAKKKTKYRRRTKSTGISTKVHNAAVRRDSNSSNALAKMKDRQSTMMRVIIGGGAAIGSVIGLAYLSRYVQIPTVWGVDGRILTAGAAGLFGVYQLSKGKRKDQTMGLALVMAGLAMGLTTWVENEVRSGKGILGGDGDSRWGDPENTRATARDGDPAWA